MNRSVIFLLSISLSFFACAFASAADKFFPMGIWYEGGVGAVRQNVIPEDVTKAAAQYDRDFADIAGHGINVVVVPNSPPAHHQAVLDAASKHHLKVILELDLDGGECGVAVRQGPVNEAKIRQAFETKLGPVKSQPALWRVQLLDEPPPGSFERYRKVADILKQYDPDMPPFCCLAGTGAVEDFAKIVQPDVIAWDNYPLGPGTPVGDAAPLRAFTVAAQQSAKIGADHNADVWGVIQCHDFANGLRFPTPAEIRCMTYASLAAGSKGVFWFLYQTERLDPTGKNMMHGLVNEQYQSSDRWDQVGKLTKEISALAPILSDLHPVENPTPPNPDDPVSMFTMRDSQGKLYIFLINFDTQHYQRANAMVHTRNIRASRISRVPSDEVIDAERHGNNLTLTPKLAPGDCEIFKVD